MKFYRLLFYSLILSLAIPAGAPAVQPEPARAAVIISRQIRPYIEVSEGVLSVLGDMADVSAEVFFLDRMKASGRDLLPEQFIDGTFTLFLAIGPEAAQYLWHRLPSTPGVKIYSVVLNPGKNIPALDANQCGIPLNIPVAQQVENIHQALPGIRRIGMIYDPAYNERF